MASNREMRQRITSVKNISQVTHALETVSASKVRKAVQAVNASRSYSIKAWKLLLHLARQPGSHQLHPLLNPRSKAGTTLVLMVSGDRGLAGSYNMNILRQVMLFESSHTHDIKYVAVGKKGRDLLLRRHKNIIAEFPNLGVPPTYNEVSVIGDLAVNEFINEKVDEVWVAYTDFITMSKQNPKLEKILPVTVEKRADSSSNSTHSSNKVFIYEPDQSELLGEIIRNLAGIKVYQTILSSIACEYASRMMAMHTATENAKELMNVLQLEYNKARQNAITGELLDIIGGVEALKQAD